MEMPCRRELRRTFLGLLIWAVTILVLYLSSTENLGYILFHRPFLTFAIASIFIIVGGHLVSSYLMCLRRYNKQYDQKPWDKRPWLDS